MTKSEWESQSLVRIIAVCYGANLLFGWSGYLFCQPSSMAQVLVYQVGNAFAISGSVMAARYVGLRGQQVAASAYILLGITHGISLAALGRTSINPDRAITMVMPMIPALVFMFWCELYPKWLRAVGMIPSLLFVLVYVNVNASGAFLGLPLYSGYATLHVLEVLWSVYLFKDWQRLK
jgi:hypothetical protein